jgi:UDP-galactopyranose mutase
VRGAKVAVVVVGGPRYSVDQNTMPNQMVRELSRDHAVLYLNSEANGSLLKRLQGHAAHMTWMQVVRTALGPMRPRQVDERLWLAPVQGTAAIGPLWAPEWMRRRNVRLFAKVIRAWLQEVSVSAPLLLFYTWALPELVASVPNVAAVYDCVDDPAALPGSFASQLRVGRLESRLLDAVDRAYVVSPALVTSRQGPGRTVALLPTSVDTRLFEELERAGFDVPDAVATIPRPRIGYVGALGTRMDWPLLLEVARRRPEWSFVLIGGEVRTAPAELRRLENAYFTGWLRYRPSLAAMSGFDAAIVPFLSNPFTSGNSCLKVREYLAHGLPIVTAHLPDTAAVASDGDGLVYIATGPDEWEAALGQALAEPDGSPLRAARRSYIEQRSTEQRAKRVIHEALAAATPDGAPRPVLSV